MSAGRLTAAGVTAVLATLAAAALWGASYDDAWITYRYADNYARGAGLVFNPGERVLGTSAPGWALALGTAARWSGLAVPELGTLLSVVSLALAGGLLPLAAARRAPPPWPWAFPLLLALLTFTAPWHLLLLGAETLPVLALGVTAAWLALAPAGPEGGAAPGPSRRATAGLLMAAAMVLRLDAALAALAVGLVLWWQRRRRGAVWGGLPWLYGAAGLLPLFVWLALLGARFGTVLPHTLTGKRSEAAPAGLAEHAWTYTGAQWRWLLRDLPPATAAVLLLLAAAGALCLARRLLSRNAAPPPWAPLVAALGGWLVLHEVAYRLVGVPFAPWYHVHLLHAVLALAAGGALAVGLAVAAPRRALAVGTAAVLLVPVLLPGAAWLATHRGAPPDARTALYAEVGRYLHRHAPPGATVAAVEIGALGYFADRPVLDLMGLVTPAAVEARGQGRLPELVAERAPEYLLVPPHFLPGLLAPVLDEVGGRYEAVATFSHPRYGGGVVTLYRRRSEAVAPPSPSAPPAPDSAPPVSSPAPVRAAPPSS